MSRRTNTSRSTQSVVTNTPRSTQSVVKVPNSSKSSQSVVKVVNSSKSSQSAVKVADSSKSSQSVVTVANSSRSTHSVVTVANSSKSSHSVVTVANSSRSTQSVVQVANSSKSSHPVVTVANSSRSTQSVVQVANSSKSSHPVVKAANSLGWAGGVTCLVVMGIFTYYANWLLAAFHMIHGQRLIRYRDLMGFVFGTKMYYITWVLQFFTLVVGNMGFIAIGGTALKAIDSEFTESPLRLQYFIIIAGVTFFVYSVCFPTMSAMRTSLAVSTVLTACFIVPILAILVKDGRSNTIKRDYDIYGSKADKVFRGFGSVAAAFVTSTGGLLPETQSTLRQPAKKNMRKALNVQFTAGLGVYYTVTIVGYWAYGSSVSSYLPNSLSGPRWVKVFINTAVFLQIIISQHMFNAPVLETLDTRFLKLDKSLYSQENLGRLILLRAALFTVNTLVTAAIPFVGDFVSFIGSFSLVILTFVFPSMAFLQVKEKEARIEKKAWHWAVIIMSTILSMATTAAAVRSIVKHVNEYSFFANVA